MRGRAGRVRLCPQGFASMAGTAGTAGSVQRQSVLRWVPRPGAPHFPRCTPCLACPPPPLPVCSTHFCHPSAPQTWVLALFRALQQLQPLAAQGPADRRLLSAREAPF